MAPHLQDVLLADSTFHQPDKQYGPRGTPVLRNSIFDWILSERSTTILTEKNSENKKKF